MANAGMAHPAGCGAPDRVSAGSCRTPCDGCGVAAATAHSDHAAGSRNWLGVGAAVVLVISQTIPIIAFAPLLILVFGFGIEPKIAVVVLFCFFPITVATLDGLQGTPSEVLSLMRSFGATRAQTWIKARFISALPSLFSGLRISATYAVTGALFGEWVTAQAGLGPYLLTGYRQGRSEQVFAAIFVVAVLSVILVVLVGVIERRLLAWHFHASGTWEDLSA
jgi:ABC-type nitrate/sulfonate/bicarbonate transport system permease component